jgi:DNA-binding response OmpR family regulator
VGQIDYPETILIIEDEVDMQRFAARVLGLEGYRVLQTVSGAQGMRLAAENGVSLVLLDLRLSDIDGWAILDMFKNDPALSSIPIVVFTASAAVSKRSQAMAGGAADYLVKPLSAAELRNAVSTALNRKRG